MLIFIFLHFYSTGEANNYEASAAFKRKEDEWIKKTYNREYRLKTLKNYYNSNLQEIRKLNNEFNSIIEEFDLYIKLIIEVIKGSEVFIGTLSDHMKYENLRILATMCRYLSRKSKNYNYFNLLLSAESIIINYDEKIKHSVTSESKLRNSHKKTPNLDLKQETDRKLIQENRKIIKSLQEYLINEMFKKKKSFLDLKKEINTTLKHVISIQSKTENLHFSSDSSGKSTIKDLDNNHYKNITNLGHRECNPEKNSNFMDLNIIINQIRKNRRISQSMSKYLQFLYKTKYDQFIKLLTKIIIKLELSSNSSHELNDKRYSLVLEIFDIMEEFVSTESGRNKDE